MPTVAFSITHSGDAVHVVSPYHPGFIDAAKKNLGGRWSDGVWQFDVRNEQAVRALVKHYFGYVDGCTLVSLRCDFGPDGDARRRGPIYRAGRVVACASGRDSGARLGQGVILERGIVTSSGSIQNWTTLVIPNTVVVIHDVPLPIAKKYADPDGDGGYEGEIYEIIRAPVVESPASAGLDTAGLESERAQLRARLAEIDGLLTLPPA